MIRRSRQSTIEAVEWWTTFRDGAPSRTDRRRFADWLSESPAHVREYLEVAALWEEMGRLKALEQVDLEALLERAQATDNVVSLETASAAPLAIAAATDAAAPGSAQSARAGGQRRRGKAKLLLFAGTACVVAAVVALSGWWGRTLVAPAEEGIVATAIGEQRSLALDDGSVIDLNTQTAIRLHLDAGERRVDLLKGEALFEIARQRGRRFVVKAGLTEVHVLGTKFNMHRQDDRTATVTVLEGRVLVKHADGAGFAEPTLTNVPSLPPEAAPASVASVAIAKERASIELTEGQQAHIDMVESTIEQTSTNPRNVVAWMDRRMIFEDASLAEVVAEFNRYNTRRLRVDDPALSRLRLNGVFQPHDPESLLQYLRRAEGVRVVERGAERRIVR